jgi:hypothetical protein
VGKVTRLKSILTFCALFSASAGFAAAQIAVRIEKTDLHGPRHLDDQTATGAIHDYLESWKSLNSAFDQNRTDLLDADFVGAAKEKFARTIQQQAADGARTRYLDRAHDIQIVFCSPEGLSIELTDTVEYDTQLLDHDKPLSGQRVHSRYIVVLTPSETRWKVRVLQAIPE